MTFIVALDLGTTGNRAIAFNTSGQIVGSHYQEFQQLFPKPAWVEHDPNEIWKTVQEVLGRLLSDIGASNVVALGITNQRETTVIWDRYTGNPIYNAIVWQCRRTSDRCTELNQHRHWIQSKTGLVLDSYFSATKIEWILNQLPKGIDFSRLKFGTIDTWILDRLTNGTQHATDPSNASRTLLWNIHTQTFDPELLDLFNIPLSILPEVRPSNSHFGVVAGTQIPITGILGDQQASLFAHAIHQPNIIKNTYGTGLFAMALSPEAMIRDHCLTTVAWKLNDTIQYATEGSSFVGGSLIQWLRDELGIIRTADDIEDLAAQSGSADGVVIVPAFVGLGSPHWDPSARGSIMGLTRGTSKSNIAYAALESIAFQSREIISLIAPHQQGPLRVDGGACQNNLLMQIQANILGTTVERAATVQSTALGAALMAGIGASIWDVTTAPPAISIDRQFIPNDTPQTSIHRWMSAVDRSKGWATLPD